MVVITENIVTGGKKVYTCPPKLAVISAYAQGHQDWNTWNYEKKYGHLVTEHRTFVQCANWVALIEEFTKPSKGKAYYKDREILITNELYVEDYGWITEARYQHLMHCVVDEPALFYMNIKQRNIQYRTPSGTEGQMNIEEQDFWENRVFVPDKIAEGIKV